MSGAGTGSWRLVPFSAERAAGEPGDFYPDISKIERLLGWRPSTSLADGLERTIAHYRDNKERYW